MEEGEKEQFVKVESKMQIKGSDFDFAFISFDKNSMFTF